MDKVIIPPFCKVCGTLAARGCPKGHDSTLANKITKRIQAEDGTHALVSRNNVDLGKEFWHYACENHHYTVYVLKVKEKVKEKEKERYKDPLHFLLIPNDVNPCSKWRGNISETYKLRDILIPHVPRVKTEAERKLDGWVDGGYKRHA